MRMAWVMAAMTAAAGLTGTAVAQTGDRAGYQAIAAGDLTAAEERLVAERRIYPKRPELMLNLAAVYRQTGRAAEARALYGDVLDRPEVMMDLPDGTVRSSHALASAGLNRLAPVMATR